MIQITVKILRHGKCVGVYNSMTPIWIAGVDKGPPYGVCQMWKFLVTENVGIYTYTAN